jgi:CrcB protein
MNPIVVVAIGGALGAVFRYLLVTKLAQVLDKPFPFGTISVNILGSLLIGIFYVVIVERAALPPPTRELVIVGFLGAFTTFSSFSLEVIDLVQQGFLAQAGLYVFSSVICCLIACYAGLWLTRTLF